MKKSEPEKDNDNNPNAWVGYIGLGSQLAVTVVVMVLLGVWLDKKFSTEPILTIIFSFIGIAGGMYNFIKTALKSGK
ncbi:MAG TPA: AtpZ/AtpI family protein [Ignavibacteriaceae bacterium]|nr:AtpZ/AtpI family protein [Ignavibacteriaceae bacterium]